MVKCKYCGKLHALKLEGRLEWYCPKCKKFQVTLDNIPQDMVYNIKHLQNVAL